MHKQLTKKHELNLIGIKLAEFNLSCSKHTMILLCHEQLAIQKICTFKRNPISSQLSEHLLNPFIRFLKNCSPTHTSTGPRTKEGLARLTETRTKHWCFTNEKRAEA